MTNAENETNTTAEAVAEEFSMSKYATAASRDAVMIQEIASCRQQMVTLVRTLETQIELTRRARNEASAMSERGMMLGNMAGIGMGVSGISILDAAIVPDERGNSLALPENFLDSPTIGDICTLSEVAGVSGVDSTPSIDTSAS